MKLSLSTVIHKIPQRMFEGTFSLDKAHCDVSSIKWITPCHHYENTPIQIYWEFYYQKIKIFK